jgi:hypothetical protein
MRKDITYAQAEKLVGTVGIQQLVQPGHSTSFNSEVKVVAGGAEGALVYSLVGEQGAVNQALDTIKPWAMNIKPLRKPPIRVVY